MRVIVVAALACAAVVVSESAVRADETVDRFAPIREQIATGKLEAARAALAEANATSAERAVAVELQFIVDTWIARGGAPREESGVAPPPPTGWEPALADARDLLMGGSYAAASFRLRALADTAPNDVRRAVASELGRLAASLSGRANEPAPKPLPLTVVDKEKPETKTRWYGWQTLLLDVTSAGIGLGGGAAGSSALGAIGGVGYVFAPPILHAFHGRPWMTLLDLGMRLGLPIIGAVIGNATCGSSSSSSDSGFGCVGPLVGGFFVGIGVAVVLDAAALSWETVPVTKSSAKLRITPGGLVW
jgi:hypothetical protein